MKFGIYILSTAFALSILSGCKAAPPQVAGKWQGTTTLTATYAPPGGAPSRIENTAVKAALLLSQNGQTVNGNASITAGPNTIDIPITVGVVTPNGRLSLEGEKSFLLTQAHFSFDGNARSGKLAGTLHLALGNVRGGADNHGSVTLTPVQ